MRGGSSPRSGQAGFSLIEMAVSLALLLLGLAIAAQLLMETSQLFAETSGESVDTPVPLVIARIRGDVQGSVGAYPVVDPEDGKLIAVAIQGSSEQIVYRKSGPAIYRTVEPFDGSPKHTALLWREVTGWSCQQIGLKGLIQLEVTYRRRSMPATPLPTLPAIRGPVKEELTQKMFLLPRGAGLGETW
jgi:prepilin-type N-terminal cleavage/methylation domain-containing protein